MARRRRDAEGRHVPHRRRASGTAAALECRTRRLHADRPDRIRPRHRRSARRTLARGFAAGRRDGSDDRFGATRTSAAGGHAGAGERRRSCEAANAARSRIGRGGRWPRGGFRRGRSGTRSLAGRRADTPSRGAAARRGDRRRRSDRTRSGDHARRSASHVAGGRVDTRSRRERAAASRADHSRRERRGG